MFYLVYIVWRWVFLTIESTFHRWQCEYLLILFLQFVKKYFSKPKITVFSFISIRIRIWRYNSISISFSHRYYRICVSLVTGFFFYMTFSFFFSILKRIRTEILTVIPLLIWQRFELLWRVTRTSGMKINDTEDYSCDHLARITKISPKGDFVGNNRATINVNTLLCSLNAFFNSHL